MKRLLFLFIFICTHTYADDMSDMQSAIEKRARIEELKSLIIDIDSEIKRCEKTKKNWTIATAIGAAGVVATGTAATIQGIQIQKAKKAEKDAAKDEGQEGAK